MIKVACSINAKYFYHSILLKQFNVMYPKLKNGSYDTLQQCILRHHLNTRLTFLPSSMSVCSIQLSSPRFFPLCFFISKGGENMSYSTIFAFFRKNFSFSLPFSSSFNLFTSKWHLIVKYSNIKIGRSSWRWISQNFFDNLVFGKNLQNFFEPITHKMQPIFIGLLPKSQFNIVKNFTHLKGSIF